MTVKRYILPSRSTLGGIKAAVSAAFVGDVIVLEPGTYTGSDNKDILLNKNLFKGKKFFSYN